MAGRTVPVEVAFLGNTTDLEASLVRAGIVAEDSSKKIASSARAAGAAAAEQAKSDIAAAHGAAGAANGEAMAGTIQAIPGPIVIVRGASGAIPGRATSVSAARIVKPTALPSKSLP